MAFSGMNVDVVKAQAKVLQTQSDQIKKITSQIDSLVHQLQSAWHGDDSKKFAAQWNSDMKSRLTKASTLLHDRSTTATQQANQQESTSKSL